MRKKWLAMLMAMVMAVSPVAVQTVEASTADEVTPYAVEIQRDSLQLDASDDTNNTENLEDGVIATSPYNDPTADPMESYEYTITGDDGSVAVVEVPAMLNRVYTKYTFTEGTPVPNGTYVIIGARSGYSLNKAVVRTDTTIFENYTKLEFQSDLEITENVITTDLTAGEWEFTYSNGKYTLKVPQVEKYFAIYTGDNGNGAVTSSESQEIQIVKNTAYGNDSIAIGGAHLTGSDDGWLNYRADASGGAAPGTWTSGAGDVGSAWYLYALNYKISDDAIDTATAGVGAEASYTADSWTTYANALTAAEGIFATTDAASTAYDELTAAVAGLKKEVVEPNVTGDVESVTYELVRITDNSYIEQGTYLLVLSRWHRAVSAEAINNNKKYVQVGAEVGENAYASETPDQTITLTKEQSEYAIEWELTKEDGAFYLKNVKTQGYLQITNGQGNVSAGLTEDTRVATNIAVYSGSETHGGSVTIGQLVGTTTQYLNMHGGYNGNTGGDSNGNDGGAAVYLYKKATTNGSFTVDVTALEEAIANAAGVTEADFTSTEKWNAFSAALTAAQTVLGKKDTVFSTMEAADEYREEVKHAKNALMAAHNEIGYKVAAYRLVRKAVDNTVIDPGVYMLVNARFYRALTNTKVNNKLGYLQVIEGTFSDDVRNNGEKAPDYIATTEDIEAANLDWEISAGAEANKYYIKNAATGNYLTIVADQAAASSSTSVETSITGRTKYGSSNLANCTETHEGSVIIGQGQTVQYLNMHGGYGGNFGGYNQGYDGGSSIYLYKKVPEGGLYESDASALQALVDTYEAENLNSADYDTTLWNVYDLEMQNAKSELAESHSFETLEEALHNQEELNIFAGNLERARKALKKTGPFSYTMEELYAAICEANDPNEPDPDKRDFLFSESVYTAESGRAYRSALQAARGTFATEDEAQEALQNLIDSVKNLEATTEAYFPEITWKVTEETTADTTWGKNYIQNLTILNDSEYKVNADAEYTFKTNEALIWEWNSIARLVNDEDIKTEPVWSKADNGMWQRQFSSAPGNENFRQADVYKISGVFEWPEGYDLHDTTIVLDSKNDFFYRDIYEYLDDENNGMKDYFEMAQVLPVNDDVYVVVWAGEEADKPKLPTQDSDGINEHLAFWAGTSGKGIWSEKDHLTEGTDWTRTEPATFIEWDLQGERTFYNSYPNLVGTGVTKSDGTAYTNADVKEYNSEYLSHTDGWYTLADTTAINSVLRGNNPDGIEEDTKIHIDLYVMNNSTEGIIDELEIELIKEREKETEVTVNYYLNSIEKDNLLGTEKLLNQVYGTDIELLPGVGACQLNSYKAQAIHDAGYREVTDGVQMNELVVTEGEDNVINVLYTVKGIKNVQLLAPTESIPYDGSVHTLNTVTVTVDGVEATANGNGKYTLPDGNIIENVYSYVSKTDPGIYANDFTMENGQASPTIIVKDAAGNDVTNTYIVTKIPGTLTITYDPEDVTYTYDFGVKNVYENAFTDVETRVNGTFRGSTEMTFDLPAKEVYYTPSAADTGDSIDVQLSFDGNYTVTKTFNFVPANNVLYEESFITSGEGWTTDGTAQNYVVTDNEDNTSTEDVDESTVYGYTSAYEGDDVWDLDGLTYSNGAALKAELTLENGASTVKSKGKASFTFTGTGFDLITTCGEDTGLLFAVVKQNGTAIKSFFVDTYFVGDDEVASGTAYQIPVIRDTELAYGTYTIDVYGYLVNTTGAGAAAASMFMIDDEMTVQQPVVSKEEILMAALQDLELEDVIDMADVTIAYMDDNSVLNGGTSGVEVASNIAMFALDDELSVADDTPTSYTGYVAVDAFRVYQPLEEEPEVYEEKDVKFASVYEFVQTSINDLEGIVDNAAVYLEYDGNTSVSAIADYKNQGPQNEVYLAPGCAVAFAVVGYEDGDLLQVSAKAVTKGATPEFVGELAGTELYYDITSLVSPASEELGEGVSYVVIRNNRAEDEDSTEGILSISELKMSSHIRVLASAELGEKVETELNVENSAFKPETLTVTLPSTAKKNRNFVIKFSGSTDIAEFYFAEDETSAGTLVNATNTKAVANGMANVYNYSKTVKETTAGTYTYYVYAVNTAGVVSERVPVTVKVQ